MPRFVKPIGVRIDNRQRSMLAGAGRHRQVVASAGRFRYGFAERGIVNPATIGASAFGQRAQNFAASFLFVTCAFLAYRYSPQSAELRELRADSAGISGADVLDLGYALYSLVLLIFYLCERSPRVSKSIAAWRALHAIAASPVRTFRHGLADDERLGLLTVLLKGFFAPLMILSLFAYTNTLIANGSYIIRHASLIGSAFLNLFNTHAFWFLFQAVLFVDVLFFTLGYLVEHPALGNEIRSVDPTWFGWGVALSCYPPLNGLTRKILGWSASDFPQFWNPIVHVAVGFALLVLMAIYASASVALNLKASNLTHRGIITHGPYRFLRHPAYACKNVAWWLGSVPAILSAWEHRSVLDAFLAASSTASWSIIYVLRARTEEAHLRSVDGEYDAYCQSVRRRFIPGIW